MAKRWYVVHAYSGFEKKVVSSLKERIALAGMEEAFGDILVPTEEVVEMRSGQKRGTYDRSCFSSHPGSRSPPHCVRALRGYFFPQCDGRCAVMEAFVIAIVFVTAWFLGAESRQVDPEPHAESEAVSISDQIDDRERSGVRRW